MRSSRFLPLSRAEASAETAVLCLAAHVRPGQDGDLPGAVLARLAECDHGAGTVVLALDGDIGADCLVSMCALHECLRARGTQLRLVIGSREAAQQLRASAVSGPVACPAVHPNLRSAVLAAYAALLGPGLVNARVRAALSAPAEPL